MDMVVGVQVCSGLAGNEKDTPNIFIYLTLSMFNSLYKNSGWVSCYIQGWPMSGFMSFLYLGIHHFHYSDVVTPGSKIPFGDFPAAIEKC